MIIDIENLSKKYIIHHQNPTHALFKETLTNSVKRGWNRLTGRASCQVDDTPTQEEFWALRNINLNIREGDKIALLGRNGAGKSTLLKVISRITEPTTGRLKIRGRVSSLLEVGTGFHPDLTGRENIYLNAAVMGMSYREMKRKFDEIVAFGDIEKFLDTPLKRYSSGMFMRLGFAIAAHLDSELLIVDEVLAVGDAQFQEKCINKMNEIGSRGSTVLFVSHNISSVLTLCNKGIFLEKGEVKSFEPIDQCVSRYQKSCPISGLEWKGNEGDENIRIYRAALRAATSESGFYSHSEETYLDIDFEILKPHPDILLGFTVLNSRSHTIARSRLCDHPEHFQMVMNPTRQRVSFRVYANLFHPGEYKIRLDCSLLNKKKILQEDILLKFGVFTDNKLFKHELGAEKDGISLGNRWTVEQLGSEL